MDPQSESLRQYPCPICGQSEFEFGQVIGQGMQHFVPGTRKFWNMPEKPWSVPKRVLVRACLNCRNIQSFVRVYQADDDASEASHDEG